MAGGVWLIEERHREVSEIKKPAFNPFSPMHVLKNPLRRLFGKRPWRVLPTITEMVIIFLAPLTLVSWSAAAGILPCEGLSRPYLVK